MQKFMKWLEEKMMPVMSKMGNQRHVLSIRDGFISAMPFMIVGSLMLILAFPPFPSDTTNFIGKHWVSFAESNFDKLLMPFEMTMGIMTIFISIGIGYSLAKSYKLNPLSGGMLSLLSFLILAGQIVEGGIPTAFLGGTGIFTALITSIFAVELMRFLKAKNFTIKMPDGVPPAISASFEALIPVFLIVAILFPISFMFDSAFGATVPEKIMELFEPLVASVDSLPAILLAVLICHLLWFAGIHGASIVTGMLQAFWLTNLAYNQDALAAGQGLPHIFAEPFWAFYIVIGGSGATLAVIFLYLRSKSAHLKAIGKVSVLPGIFNINEPIIFGTPIVMNPMLFFPFILAPMANGTIAYLALRLNLIDRIVALPPWTTPAPIGAMWAAGWDVKAFVLVLILAAVSGIIYYPFVKMYEKKMLMEEQEKDSTTASNNTTINA